MTIREAREMRGLTMTDLAKIIKRTPQQVWQWETGVRKPGFKSALLISNALDVPVLELLLPRHKQKS